MSIRCSVCRCWPAATTAVQVPVLILLFVAAASGGRSWAQAASAQTSGPETSAAEPSPEPQSAAGADDAAALQPEDAAPVAGAETPEPEPLSPEARALDERFEQQRLEWAETLAEMRAIQIRYNNQVDRSAAAWERFEQLREQSREQMDELFAIAKELFALRDDHFGAGSMLATMLDYRRENSVYEDSYEAAKMLLDAGATMPVLYLTTARAAFLEGHFDEVLPLYEKFVEAESPEELEKIDHQLVNMLDSYPPRWEEELERRRADAEAGDLPRVLLETTRGPVVVELFEDAAPNTVANFISLVEEGFYDETEFYQVISDLLVVGGDPNGDGSGTSGRFIPDEHDHPQRRHIFRGSLFMAKVPSAEGADTFVPDSASSQFIIAIMPMMPKEESQTVFGRVVEGMDVIGAFQRLDPQEKKEQQVQLPPDRIITARVIRKRDHDYSVTYTR